MVLFASLALSACAQQPQIATLSTTQVVPAQNAFAIPGPGGPAVTSVLERRYSNAVEQQIALATSSHVSGQNMLRVQLFGPLDSGTTGQTRLREGFLPPGNVTAEMRQLIPGVRMVRSPYYVQNRYGPFGYAVGHSSSGDTCLYGWQRLTSTGNTQTLVGNKGSIQIRLRYCDKALSEQRLLQVMYDFTISAYFRSGNWNPYGEPNAPDASLGKAGAAIYPVGGSEFAPVAKPRAQQAPTRSRSSGRQATKAAAAPKPEPVGPVVPAPPGSDAMPATPDRLQRTAPAGRSEPSAIIVPPPPCNAASGTCREQERIH